MVCRALRPLAPLFAAAAVLSPPHRAAADTSRVPHPHVQRPLTLPKATLRIDGGPRWPEPDTMFKHVVVRNGTDAAYLNPGVSAGIARDLEIGGVLPLLVAPDVDLANPRFYVLYRFGPGDVQVGAFAEVELGIEGNTAVTGGFPVFVRLGDIARLETGGFLQLVLADDLIANLYAPLVVPFQVSSDFYLGPEAGIGLWNVGDTTGVSVPLGIFFGYTLGSTLGDLIWRARMPDVEVGLDVVELMFGAELFFDL